MTLSEVRQRREALEAILCAALRKFEDETGLKVRSVELTRYTTIGTPDQIGAVMIDAEIGRLEAVRGE